MNRLMKITTIALVVMLASLAFAQVKAPADGGSATSVVIPVKTAAVTPVVIPVKTAAVTPAVVPVATPVVEMPWWKVLIREGLELIFAILGIMATAFVTVLMRKYGFEDYSAKVNDALTRAIGYAEQKSAMALKLDKKPLDGAEKLSLALDFIAEKAKEYKLPDKGREWWTKKVEGWLGAQKVTASNSK